MENISLENLASCFNIKNHISSWDCIINENWTDRTFDYNEECPDPCKDVRYETDIVTSVWSSIKKLPSFYYKYISGKHFEYRFTAVRSNESINNMTTGTQQKLYEMIKENFVIINVRFNLGHI